MNETELQILKDEVSEQFNESVSFEDIQDQSVDGATLIICSMKYLRGSSNQPVHQTAVILRSEDLDLPRFSMHPRMGGLLTSVVSRLGTTVRLDFDDSPEFQNAYSVQAWKESATRILFSAELRDFLGRHPGWCTRGRNQCVIIYQDNKLCTNKDMEGFVQAALQILNLFRAGERALDNRPEVQRDISGRDMLETADRMGGIGGAMLRSQLEEIAVSAEDLATFLDSPVPRPIPAGIKRQVVGDNLMLLFLGPVFMVAGLGVGGGLIWFGEQDRALGVGILLMFCLCGSLMFGLTWRHRRRKYRVLQHGVLTEGQVLGVRKTDLKVNGQYRYIATVKYRADGSDHSTACNIYGPAAEQARRLAATKATIHVLVDPTDADHVAVPDFLMLFD